MSVHSAAPSERATQEELTEFLEGFPKISSQQQTVLLKLAFDHVTPECRDILLRYIEAVTLNCRGTTSSPGC